MPADDWYCTSCQRIVQSQYIISVTSEDESDSAYVPGSGATFQLDLSSDVDITGSDSDPDSDDSCPVSMSAASYPFPQVMSEANEDVFVDVMEDAPDLTGHASLPSACSTPLASSCASCKALNGSCTPSRPFNRHDSMDGSSSDDSDIFSKRQKRPTSNMDLGSPSSSDTSVIIVGQSVVAKRRRGNQRGMFSDEESENLELGISRNGSESGNSPSRKEGEKGNSPLKKRSVKGKSPLLQARKNHSKKKLHYPAGSGVSETDVPSPCVNRDPLTFSDTIVLSSDDDLFRQEGHTRTLFNGHAFLPRPSENALSSDEGQQRVRPSIQHGIHAVNSHTPFPGPSEKSLLPDEGSASSAGRRVESGNTLTQQERKRPRKRRKKIVQIVGTRKKVHDIRKKRRRKQSKKRRVRRGNAFIAGVRSRARTAATHTPRKNIMRAAVRESYRHDNQMEGLEWARAILARASSGTPLRHRSEFFQNFPTPTSGYVERTGVSKLEGLREASQDTTRDASPPVSRMYGFTPSNKQRIRPSLLSSSLDSSPPNQNHFYNDPGPLPSVTNGRLNGLAADARHASSRLPYASTPLSRKRSSSSQGAKKKCVTARQRMLKEANHRLSKCAKVLITPVKYRGKGDCAKGEGGGSLSSSSEPAASSSDPLGDIWRGLEVLEGEKNVIRRDGTIAPCGML